VGLALAAIRVAVVSDPEADDVLVTNGIAVDVEGDAVAEDGSSAVAAGGIAVLGAPVAALVPETAAAQAPRSASPTPTGSKGRRPRTAPVAWALQRPASRHGRAQPRRAGPDRQGRPDQAARAKNTNTQFLCAVPPNATRCA